MQTFIQKYLIHTQEDESPLSFWKWSAYATIAAVLRDSCYRKEGDGAIFPNIYVLFLAESGGRKGPPVNLSEKLLYKIANTKIISGRASVQAILDELSRAETDKKTGQILKAGSAIFYAQELAAGIVADPEAINILTDIYDYKSNPYKSRLRSGPCFNLERIVFTILAASNEDMLKQFFNVTAIKGGMLARTFLITPNETRPANSRMFEDWDARQKSFATLEKALGEISRLQGEFKFTDTAKEEYHTWYNDFKKKYQKNRDQSGVIARIHTGIIKIAMILAANDLTLCVDKRHIEESILECLGLLPGYNTLTMGQGKTTISAAAGLVLTALFERADHKLGRKEIIMQFWQEFDAETLDKVVVTLESGGIIKQYMSGSESTYGLTDQGLNMIKGGLGGK